MSGSKERFPKQHPGDPVTARFLNEVAGSVSRSSQGDVGRNSIQTSAGSSARMPKVHGMLVGKTLAAHNKGELGNIQLYHGRKGSEIPRTGAATIISAYNRFADLGADKWVHVEWIDQGYELTSGEC